VIDSRQIAAFAALVRHRRFTLAAEDLFLTQSAVSHAIKTLERDVGCRLFERTGRSVVPTRAGQRFHQHTEKILDEMRAARLELEDFSAAHHRQLCVGAGTLAVHYILPPVLREFRKKYPKCKVLIEAGKLDDLLDLMTAHKLDFAIGLASGGTGDFVYEDLFTDELLFYVAPHHPWARLRRVPRAEIAEETFVIPLKDGPTSTIVEKHLRAEKITPVHLTAPGSLEAAKQLVAAGFGVGVFTRWQVKAEAAQGAIVAVPVTAKRLVRRWVAARPKGRELLPIEQEFIKSCKEAFADLDREN
jgi:DNA-binding transcriptional LysR family regulator